MVSYQEYMSKLNDKTKEFMLDFLKKLSNYVGQNGEKLKVEGRDYAVRKIDKVMLIALYTITKDNEKNDFFGKMGFNRNRIKINEPNASIDLEKVYTLVAGNLPDFDNIYDPSEITPLEIVKSVYGKYSRDGNDETLDNLIDVSLSTFRDRVTNKIDTERKEREEKLEKELFKDIHIEIVSYFEYASEMFGYLVENDIKGNLVKNNIDIAQAALLLSIYDFDDHKKGDEKTSKEWIIDYLDSCGIDSSNLEEELDIDMPDEDDLEEKNMFVIKKFFMEYLDGLDMKTATVTDVLGNVFKKGKEKSRFFEKLLNIKLDSTLDLDADFKQNVDEYKTIAYDKEIKDKLGEIYSYITNDVKETLELSSKIYSLILKNKGKKSILKDYEIGILSSFISYCYTNPLFKEFLESKGISIDKMFKEYGIKITEEDIENEPINYELFIDVSKHFFNTNNKKEKPMDILTSKLFSNEFICNLYKRMSGILDDDIDYSFYLFNNQKEKEEEKKLKSYFCTGLDGNTIDFIERAYKIFVYLSQIPDLQNKLTNEDLKFLSIMLAGSRTDITPAIARMLEANNLIIGKYFNVGINYYTEREVNYKQISDEFSYIFKDGTPRKDIDVKKVVKDAFKMNLGPEILKFFKAKNVTVNADNFDVKYDETVKEMKIQKATIDITEKLIEYEFDTRREIVMVLKTYDYILKKFSAGELKSDLIKDKDDVKEISLLIGILTGENNYKRFFNKRRVDLDTVIKLCGLTENDIKTIECNPDIVIPYLEFEKQFEKKNDPSHAIFLSETNKSHVLENIISHLGESYEQLKIEIECGKDYESTLSVDDRIEILKEQDVDTLDYDDITSLLHFGDSLKIHTNYINDELPKVDKNASEAHDKSMSDLNQLISSVCKDKEQVRKKGLLALFGKKEDKTKTVDKTSLKTLKESIDDNIALLSQEIVGYDTIRKYLEAYYAKNIEYLKKATDAAKLVEGEVSKLDPNNSYEFAKFTQLTSVLQVVKEKTRRFDMTCRLVEQQLIRINQATASHFITISALETAKNDLFPLVGTEMAIARGIESERDAIEVTQNVMNLFKSLLSRNIDEAKDNLDMLSKLDIPEGYVAALQSDLKQYSEQVESIKMPELPKRNDDISYTPTLELDDDNTKTPKKKAR